MKNIAKNILILDFFVYLQCYSIKTRFYYELKEISIKVVKPSE